MKEGESAMKQQLILPSIPAGATEINNRVGVWRENDQCTYFFGGHPIYSHKANDLRMFRIVTSQLIEAGGCRLVDILRTFGVSKNSVIRSMRKLRQGGVEAFFKPRPVEPYSPNHLLITPKHCWTDNVVEPKLRTNSG